VDLVRQYHAQLQAGVPDIETRALEFVKMWLTAHVLGTDREIGAYAAERPVGGESGLSPSSLLT
jgi:hemerythrin